MKKISYMIAVLILNFSFYSCTEESVEEIILTQTDPYSTEGEEEKVDPEEKPPGMG